MSLMIVHIGRTFLNLQNIGNYTFPAACVCNSPALREVANLSEANLSSRARAPLSLQERNILNGELFYAVYLLQQCYADFFLSIYENKAQLNKERKQQLENCQQFFLLSLAETIYLPPSSNHC